MVRVLSIYAAAILTESKAFDYANHQVGFGSYPIRGILCNGTSFEFFSFDGSTKPPTFSKGVFSRMTPSGITLSKSVDFANLQSNSATEFILSLRPICETIFAFLHGYEVGLLAYYHRSVPRELVHMQRTVCSHGNGHTASRKRHQTWL